jgi:hypothetical protein
MLDAAGLLPGEHAVDCGYTSADLLLAARARGITLPGPLLANISPQARAGRYAAETWSGSPPPPSGDRTRTTHLQRLNLTTTD